VAFYHELKIDDMKQGLRLFTISIFIAFVLFQTNAQSQITSDTITFETPSSDIIILPGGGNLWQIGKPQKIYFNSALSLSKAIVTDTLNYYPPRDTSRFIYIIQKPYYNSCSSCIEFWHKYDMDTLGDHGIIQASYDGGNSWLRLNDSSGVSASMGNFIFLWNSDLNGSGNYVPHKLITSGRSDGWILSEFCWFWWIPVKSDTIVIPADSLMIRFTFISDSIIKNKEGWMIDNISVYANDPANCSGINENLINRVISVFPNPSNGQIKIQINGGDNSTIQAIQIFNLMGECVYQSSNTSTMDASYDLSYLPDGIYYMRLYSDKRAFTQRFAIQK
jgi:hypothetical protein